MRIADITAWEAFLGVAKHGSFSQAAKLLKLSTSQLSKQIAKLESQLGVRLFQRSTRAVSLTDEGRALVPKIGSILADLASVEDSVAGCQEISGTVRITCVPFVARRLLLPALKEFMTAYPAIHIHLELSTTFVNLIEAGFDVAIRIDTPTDSDLVYRKLAPNDLVLCASPAYLKNARQLRGPKDLEHHDLLMLGIHHRCKFKDTSLSLGKFTGAKRFSCEDGEFLTDAALQGLGILVRSLWDVQEHLSTGALVQVLPNYPLETFGHIHAVTPSKRLLAPRVRFFLDFILKQASTWDVSSRRTEARAITPFFDAIPEQ